ncbi:hypothetical protein ESRG_01043 [Escherichia coli TA124]|nr:hypothetical protein ESRG_01043 [Escherichia coli TA124]
MLVLSESFKNKLLPMNGYMKGGSDSGSKAQARATEKGIELQREMWQTNMQNLAPFTPLAQQYVSQLQNLSSLQGQGQALNQYYNSQQYKDLAGQARYQSLAAAEATGGLGSTATGNQLAAIAPTLGQNWLSGQMNNYNNLANIALVLLQVRQTLGRTTLTTSANCINSRRRQRQQMPINRLVFRVLSVELRQVLRWVLQSCLVGVQQLVLASAFLVHFFNGGVSWLHGNRLVIQARFLPG